MNSGSQISYRINGKDEIVFINNEWIKFAFQNGAPELVSNNVLRHSIWDFICHDTTIHLYRMILRQVRAGHNIKFNLRCDSPALRRVLEMTVSLRKNGDVQFITKTVRTEERPPPNILSENTSDMDEVIIICSWCNKIRADEGDWQEIEEFLQTFGVLDFKALPQPSHGMCDDCYKIVSEKFQNSSKD